MDFFGFLSRFIPTKEISEEQKQQEDFFWQTQGANSISMPSMYKVKYSDEGWKEIEALGKAKIKLLDTYLESKQYKEYAELQYVEPKIINGYHSWSTPEGKELCMARLDLQNIQQSISSIGVTPYYYDTRITQNGEVENDTIRRAKQRVSQAQKAFDKIADQMTQEDLFHYEKKKKWEIGRARQQKERKESPIYKERQEYNEVMRKAGSRKDINSLPDYSLGESDRKSDRKSVNMKNEQYDPNYNGKEAGRGNKQFSFLPNSIPTLPANAETWKEDNIAEFDANTKPQNYQPDLIDGIKKIFKFW